MKADRICLMRDNWGNAVVTFYKGDVLHTYGATSASVRRLSDLVDDLVDGGEYRLKPALTTVGWHAIRQSASREAQ